MRGGKTPRKPVLVPPVRVVTRQSSDIVAIEDRDIAGAVQFIRDHADRPFNVKELLQQVPVSRRHLEQQFRQLLGRSPAGEILRVRLERAKSLLGETDLPIPEVGAGSGFTAGDILGVFPAGSGHDADDVAAAFAVDRRKVNLLCELGAEHGAIPAAGRPRAAARVDAICSWPMLLGWAMSAKRSPRQHRRGR